MREGLRKNLFHPHLEALIYLRGRLATIENFRSDMFEKNTVPDSEDLIEIEAKICSLKNTIKYLENSH